MRGTLVRETRIRRRDTRTSDPALNCGEDKRMTASGREGARRLPSSRPLSSPSAGQGSPRTYASSPLVLVLGLTSCSQHVGGANRACLQWRSAHVLCPP